ncbi:hypothetical protein COU96_02115 [Candidatus Shapirobacteria bacterium CG10_big_fil_rev_8_21_14_0_10_38_14]|uniref:Uncharacterized protein n=1 Tax=Candidatus Shapirobacteria bacterium CG10_big_fil_rev_8_21_14_0_10_38_14 TaxID=1974483 RepID=A0A2M8L5G1_9BACT|nr:MAG: hypothetical protein COU96_02115 [Candidatus Shapirobacteria bacterium CG10_big_fil_rev_8_21_14_0_10_38_14]
MSGPFGPGFGNPFGNPLGGGFPSIQVGGRTKYPDIMGRLYDTPGQAIAANQRLEPDFSRGASGGCNQDPNKVPNR